MTQETAQTAAQPLAPLVPAPLPGEDYIDLPTRLRRLAQAAPDAPCLTAEGQHLTRAEFVARMHQGAGLLQARGIGPGDVVATLAGVTVDHVCAYMAIVAAGAAVATLPTSAAPEALQRMGDNSGAVLVLGDAQAGPGLGYEDLSAFWAQAAGHAPAQPVAIGPDDLLDILYSSGTTGHPKGIEHDARFRDRQIFRFRNYGFDDQAVCLISTPIYSNTTLVTLLPALGQGSHVVLMQKFDSLRFLQLAQKYRVSHTMLVPVQIRRLIEHPDFDSFDLSAFQVKLCTSAPLTPPLLAQVLQRWPGRMINIYGMTEGGVSTILDCTANPDKLHTVGKPVLGGDVRFIDDTGAEVAAGEIGEIVGRSPTLMRGYRNAPDATRAVVWNSPEGHSYMRTGDMGRLDEDGFLILMDRKKDMIISGGFNIYACDLEDMLARNPAVHEAAVVGVADADWGEIPVAYVTLKGQATAEDILATANAALGKTQRLKGLKILPEMPRSAIGKILKRELREQWQS